MNATQPTNLSAHKKDFPILSRQVNGVPLVYMDWGASAQKPQAVLDAVDAFYAEHYANIHRGVHTLSQEATAAYEGVRGKVRRFIGAAQDEEIIFTKGCTESINLVASSWGWSNLKPGDEILLSEMEHHANIVPWQLIAERTGAVVKPIPITDDGELDLDAYDKLLSDRTKVVGITHISNVLGTKNPIGLISERAHKHGAIVLVDGAQAGPHETIDVQALGADFYTLSCHKMYAPTGVGVLYGRKALLDAMPPYQGGGDMIRTVSFSGTTFAPVPTKFEAGTPNIAGVVGLGAAIDYIGGIGKRNISAYEGELVEQAQSRLLEIKGLAVQGTTRGKASIISFTVDGIHPHDMGTILDGYGIAVRTGHHCCMPLMTRLGLPATSRASLNFTNTMADVEKLVHGIRKAQELFA